MKNADEDIRIAKESIKTKTSYNLYTESYDLVSTINYSLAYQRLEAKDKAKVVTDTLQTLVKTVNNANKNPITSLTLSDYEISAESAKAIIDALNGTNKLTDLTLKNTRMQDNAVKVIIDGLNGNKSLTSLTLQGNSIGQGSAEAMIDALKNNTTITSLDLSNNNIGVTSIKAIADGLKNNTTLISFQLMNFGSERQEEESAVKEGLKNHPSICFLNGNKTDYYNKVVKAFKTLEDGSPNKVAGNNLGLKSTIELYFSKPMLRELVIKSERFDDEERDSIKNTANVTGQL